jgi:hypothetical protein
MEIGVVKMVVAIIIAIALLTIMLSCCKVSGDCSREEEEKYGK